MRTEHKLLLGQLLPRHLNVLNGLSLIDSATVFNDSLNFILFVWTVIARQQEQFLAFVGRHDRSAIANIGNVALFADNQNNDSTAATPLMHRRLFVSLINESALSLKAASCERLCRVLWEAGLVYDD